MERANEASILTHIGALILSGLVVLFNVGIWWGLWLLVG